MLEKSTRASNSASGAHQQQGVVDQAAVFAFLEDPVTHRLSGPVTRVDTHAAAVFLAGPNVYKVKRAVRFPFMDQSTLDRRRVSCEVEVTVNSRFTPDLYLGVVPITRDGDRLAIGHAYLPGTQRNPSLVETVFQSPYTGLSLARTGDPQAPRTFGMHRWHILDSIGFERDLKIVVQALGWWPDEYRPLADDIASVAFWYQGEPHAKFPVLLPRGERLNR